MTSQLETTTSQAATTIDQKTFDDLPIAMTGAARSVTSVADLMPGVADTAAIGYGSTGAQGQEFSTTISGGQAWGGAVMYDGIPFISANQSGDYRIQPVPVEALQEFSLVQNNFSAEFSRTPGGNLTYTTRNGTNAFHGQAYEYTRNTALDAAGYFASSTTGHAPERVWRKRRWTGHHPAPLQRERQAVLLCLLQRIPPGGRSHQQPNHHSHHG